MAVGAVLYARPPAPEAPVNEEARKQLLSLGIDPDADQEAETVVPVWPENRQSVHVFMRLRTQWRVGMAGATGLDYAALTPELWRLTKTRPRDRRRVFDDLQVLEVAALNEMNRKTDG